MRLMIDAGKRRALAISFFASLILSLAALGSDHPGNVYVVGDDVVVAVPATWTDWRAVDVDGKAVGLGQVHNGSAQLGKLPIGYFEIRQQKDSPAVVTAAVVAKSMPTENTPIALDTAMSWFYPEAEKIRDACTLCKLAGVEWIRDRSSWPEIETERGTWAKDGTYERAMRLEHEAGLKVLQVNHISPAWATKNSTRFPEDLRDVFAFYRGVAKRWNGLADAVEPWNEPDIQMFGGHTGCEIASFQKAAYLGLKAGDPKLQVNESVFAIDRKETLDEFAANEVYPYFEVYDLHHYIGLAEYSRAYGRHRAVSAGRPMWTTEFNLTVHWADEKTKEPSADDLRVQGFRVGKVFAQALFEGSEKAFYFILGDYVEHDSQFGLVHQDLTPRPAYVAFAAVGRLLNGAVPIGRVDLGNDKLKGYLFKTQVDGADRETLVAWSETQPTTVDIPAAENVYDYLGRTVSRRDKVELTRATVYMILPPGGSAALKVERPPAKAKWVEGNACPVVLQLVGQGDCKQSAFRLDESSALRLVAYNFGEQTARGKFLVKGASTDTDVIEIAPGGRKERTLKVGGAGNVTARLELDEKLGHAIVSARIATAAPTSGPSK